ncbi:MAG: metallo-mystery pair system four-Cys motif protein [Myxococcales bacterium]|nr:metallo-mystery pair system four-Cys motif protein [Polyangiaceae bacterium]MDW8248571.1 metallo-mystery pair system four-Cys motif protein [Myxococcales bacterium]
MKIQEILLPVFLPLLVYLPLGGCGDETAEEAQLAAGSGGAVEAGAGGATGSSVGGSAGEAALGGQGGGSGEIHEIPFEARVGSETFSCQKTFTGIGTAKSEVQPLDFRFYVHDVRLVTEGGQEVPFELDQDGVWQYEGLALLDFEDKTGSCTNGTVGLHTGLRGKVPAGIYKGLRFKVGVPFALNHGDSAKAPSPLNLSTMFWSWNGGYKFLRVDFKLKGGAPRNLHLGSTGCQGQGDGVTSCSHPNRPEIALDGFDLTSSKVLIDYAALMADTDLSKDGGGAPGCMSGVDDPECAAIFPRLGLSLQTGVPEGKQVTFRLE